VQNLQTVRIMEPEACDIDVIDAADEKPDVFSQTLAKAATCLMELSREPLFSVGSVQILSHI
jgi:hypothetical protein